VLADEQPAMTAALTAPVTSHPQAVAR
jgi:hypothetical protein